MSAAAINIPGPTPAMNSSPTDVSVETANRIIGTDGGLITPSSAALACNDAANGRGYPWRSTAGIRIAPTANVVATLEPATAAKIMQVLTLLMAKPRCTPPTRLLANSTILSDIPPASMRLPARMKNGTATKGYLSSAA